jgi:transposase
VSNEDEVEVKFKVDATSALGQLRAAKASVLDLREALTVASNKTLDTERRLGAASHAMGMLTGSVTSAVAAYVAFARSVDEANVRMEVNAAQARTLGSATQEVARTTAGAAGQTEAWAARNALLGLGIRANAQQIGVFVEAARRHREAGESTTEAMARLASAVGGNTEAQERFGVSLSTTTDNTGRLQQATTLLTDEQRRLGAATQTEAERQEALNRQIQRGTDAFTSYGSRILETIAPITGAYRTTRETLGLLGAAIEGHDTRQRNATTATRNATSAVEEATVKTNINRSATEDAARAIELLKNKQDAARDSARAQAAALDAATEALKRAQNAASSVNFTETAGRTQAEIIQRNINAGIETIRRQRAERTNRRLAARTIRGTRVDGRRISGSEANQAMGYTPDSGPGTPFEFLQSVQQLLGQLQSSGVASNDNARLAGLAAAPSVPTGITTRSSVRDAVSTVRKLGEEFGGEQYALVGQRRRGENETAFAQRVLPAITQDIEQRLTSMRGQQDAISAMERRIAELEREETVAMAGKTTEAQLAERTRSSEDTAALLEKGDLEEQLERTRTSEEAFRSSFTSQFAEQFLPAAEQTRTAAEKMAEGVKGAFDAMSGAITSHVQALMAGRETIGEALRGITHETLNAIAEQAIPKALFETAQGIAALAIGNVNGAGAHFAAAGTYAAVAALAGLGAAATAPPATSAAATTAGAAGTALNSPAQLRSGDSSRGEKASITINVNGAVIDREGFEDALVEGLRGARQRGLMAA